MKWGDRRVPGVSSQSLLHPRLRAIEAFGLKRRQEDWFACMRDRGATDVSVKEAVSIKLGANLSSHKSPT